jgi:L-ascorbate peroxidase
MFKVTKISIIGSKPTVARSTRGNAILVVKASADSTDRRSILGGIAGALAAPIIALPALADDGGPAMITKTILPDNLSAFQKKDIISEFTNRSLSKIRASLGPEDAAPCLRLLIQDASTYDVATKTGGVNGSIVLSEELKRPENKDLKAIVDKLAKIKKEIDASNQSGQDPISWADLMVLAVKVATEAEWRQARIDRAKDPEYGADEWTKYGNLITVRIGRKDATTPDAGPVKALPPTASVEEVKAFFNKLGPTPGKLPLFFERVSYILWGASSPDREATEAAFAADPDFNQWKKKYDKSKKTFARVEYEVDFNDYLDRLANLGAQYNPGQYLVPISFQAPNRF